MADITLEPWTFYNVTVRCNTAEMTNRDDPNNPKPCDNYLREWPITQVYSNAGDPGIQCGLCEQRVEILSAEKMDPQPEVS